MLLEKYVDAFHEYDVDALVALMRDDATLSMPRTLWLQGPEAIRTWLLGQARDAAARGWCGPRPAARRHLPNIAARPTAATAAGR